MVDVFISYSRDDANAAALFARTLALEGFDVWWDQRIPTGMTWREYIPHKIDTAKSVVVLWSSKSSMSDWVKEEAGLARDKKKLLPVLIDETNVPFGFREYECAQLIGWSGDRTDPEWFQLLEGIKRISNIPDGNASSTSNLQGIAGSRAEKFRTAHRSRALPAALFVAVTAALLMTAFALFNEHSRSPTSAGISEGLPTKSSHINTDETEKAGRAEVDQAEAAEADSARNNIRSAEAIKAEVDAAVLLAEDASRSASLGLQGYQVVERAKSTWRGEDLKEGILSGIIEFKNGNRAAGQFYYNGRIFFGERYVDQTLGVSTFYGKDANIDGQPRYTMGVLEADDGTKLVGSWNTRTFTFVGSKTDPDGKTQVGKFSYIRNKPSVVTPN